MFVRVKEWEGSSITESMRKLLEQLLLAKRVDAVLVPKRYPDSNNVAHALVTDPEKLQGVDPLAPVQMVNAAHIVKELAKTPLDKKIAVVLRPCEVRATVELIKLKQANNENLILIGHDCPGVYNLKDYLDLMETPSARKNKETFTHRYLEQFLSSQPAAEHQNIREACRLCTHFTADSADLGIAWIGSDLKELIVEVRSEESHSLLPDSQELSELPQRTEKVDEIRNVREKNRDEVSADLLSFMDRCMRCYNCREVCPICYCKECLLKPEKMGYTPERYISRAIKKGQIKMPVDTLLYHLTKMNHMASSCVACGLCEQACPMDIPLGRIYSLVGRDVQALFDYEAGRSLDEELPVLTFREEELEEVEDLGSPSARKEKK
ncbi:Coenzyme F420 hydrogenase/dehydrogenase, beta subunit C-terminal domain [Candidatus Poribacteria bacterium]